MSRAEFADFLEASIAVLAREVPESHARLCRALAGRAVRFRVDAAPFCLRFDSDGCERRAGGEPCEVELELSRRTVLDLVEGRSSLDDALASDRFRLRGALDSLGTFLGALEIYLAGAVRAPAFPDLLEAYGLGRRPPAPPDGE